MSLRLAVLLATLTVGAPVAGQEVMYVTDVLQLGLFPEEGGGGAPLRTLVSGNELVVLERGRNYVKVRTSDGDEGWTKTAYLVTEKPARFQVNELIAARDSLGARAASAEAELNSARTEASELRERADAASREAVAATEELTAVKDQTDRQLAGLQIENRQLRERVESYYGAVPLHWGLGAMGASLLLGVYLGYGFLARRIRRRYGGLRIY